MRRGRVQEENPELLALYEGAVGDAPAKGKPVLRGGRLFFLPATGLILFVLVTLVLTSNRFQFGGAKVQEEERGAAAAQLSAATLPAPRGAAQPIAELQPASARVRIDTARKPSVADPLEGGDPLEGHTANTSAYGANASSDPTNGGAVNDGAAAGVKSAERAELSHGSAAGEATSEMEEVAETQGGRIGNVSAPNLASVDSGLATYAQASNSATDSPHGASSDVPMAEPFDASAAAVQSLEPANDTQGRVDMNSTLTTFSDDQSSVGEGEAPEPNADREERSDGGPPAEGEFAGAVSELEGEVADVQAALGVARASTEEQLAAVPGDGVARGSDVGVPAADGVGVAASTVGGASSALTTVDRPFETTTNAVTMGVGADAWASVPSAHMEPLATGGGLATGVGGSKASTATNSALQVAPTVVLEARVPEQTSPAAAVATAASACASSKKGDAPTAQCQGWCAQTAATFHCPWCKCRGCAFCEGFQPELTH
eukprot:CAMPEP_0119403248 /NCGR_PEP_ID=MMETSP1334-20130426/143290_1 /TAXON_ID=127549 /ORGANISM="Calcidiscus leptoporus, Strain RCC1130" /LENGTH=489 /DNA_ID=CAMNT_0007427193 /DNA_START=104 /DNA_END=1574 /DNA_ORIENTATION=+